MPAEQEVVLVTEKSLAIEEKPLSLELNQSQDLIDIEAPLEPGFDWTSLIDSLLWIAVLLVLLAVLLKFGKRFYQPAALRWQLHRLTAKCHELGRNGDFITFDQAWLLYGWCLKLQKITKKSFSEKDGITPSSSPELESLLVKVNQLSFSKQPVSRETYLGLLSEADAVLQASSGWLFFKNNVSAMLKTLVAGKS